MNTIAGNYKSDGGYVIISAVNTSTTWMSGHFSSNNYRYMYAFQLSGQFNNTWGTYGGSQGTFPYKIVVDRDGFVRFSGLLAGAETCWKQCLGVS